MIILINSFLWALGGTWNKNARRLGIPLLNIFLLRSFAPLVGFLVLPIGYGVNENEGEKSSFLGTLFKKLTNNNFFLANLFTRFTVGILYGLSTVWYHWHSPIKILYAVLIITITTVLFGVFIKNEPTIKIWKWQLNVEEILIGFSYGTIWII